MNVNTLRAVSSPPVRCIAFLMVLLAPISAVMALEVPVDWPLNDKGTSWTQFSIPIGYGNGGLALGLPSARKADIQRIQRVMGPTGVAVQKIQLWALWPSMEIPVAKAVSDMYVHAGSNATFFSLQSGPSEFQLLTSIWADSAGAVCTRPTGAKSTADLICRNDHAFVQEAPVFGLKHRGIEISRYPNIYRNGAFHDIYYVPDLGDGLTTFIRCSEDEPHPLDSVPNPAGATCEQLFLIQRFNASARVSYGREHLKDWRLIQDAWVQKLQSFLTK